MNLKALLLGASMDAPDFARAKSIFGKPAAAVIYSASLASRTLRPTALMVDP